MATATAAQVAPQEIELARLKRREPLAWSLLFEREYPLVFRVVLGRVREPAVAEDIASQVFLEAMQGIGRYRDRGRPMTAWLLTIARHRSLDWFRKARREHGIAIEPVGDGPESGLTVALDALAVLTHEQREVIHLRFVEGYSLEEVGRMTGRKTGAVKSLQHRALARLKTVIGEQEGRP
ncbi:MAG: RNA polymerase sigma factor [Dehalococcoidia bacterium]